MTSDSHACCTRSHRGRTVRLLARLGLSLALWELPFAGEFAGLLSASASAQEPTQVTPAEGEEPPAKPTTTEPQVLELLSKDQMLIHCVYYLGKRGSASVPVILLHGWEGPRGPGSGQDLTSLALQLHRAGHAVAVPDLRGHGRSTRRQLGGGQFTAIERQHLRPAELRTMILDVEAVRSFLLDENNAQRLNIDQLCVIGFEMGSVVALNWILYDWSVPSLPTLKQGQDVKAFVLVSPEQSFKGMDTRQALAHPVVCGRLSAMVIYGKGDPASDAGKRVYTTLRRAHRVASPATANDERLQDLFLVELDTRLRGTKLLGSEPLAVADYIEQFIQRRLVDRAASFPWHDRSRTVH
jgi:pimeloyl-ACP methyl ester carboxylesterase